MVLWKKEARLALLKASRVLISSPCLTWLTPPKEKALSLRRMIVLMIQCWHPAKKKRMLNRAKGKEVILFASGLPAKLETTPMKHLPMFLNWWPIPSELRSDLIRQIQKHAKRWVLHTAPWPSLKKWLNSKGTSQLIRDWSQKKSAYRQKESEGGPWAEPEGPFLLKNTQVRLENFRSVLGKLQKTSKLHYFDLLLTLFTSLVFLFIRILIIWLK